MAYSRIFGILDLELSQYLLLSFTIEEHLTRPGSTTILPKDRFRFGVLVENNSAIPLRNIEGIVRPTALAQFPETRFDIAQLAPERKRTVCTLEALASAPCWKGCLPFDQIGTVELTAIPDLSLYRIEKLKPLKYRRSA